MDVIKRLDRPMAMDFLAHLCERWKIGSRGTSWEYWRQYKQLYSSVTGQYFDRNDNREVQKVRLVWFLMTNGGSLTTASFLSGIIPFWSRSGTSDLLTWTGNQFSGPMIS